MLESSALRYHKMNGRRKTSDHGPLRSMVGNNGVSRSLRSKVERGPQQQQQRVATEAPPADTITIRDEQTTVRKSNHVRIQKMISWQQKCYKPDESPKPADATMLKVRAGSSPNLSRKSMVNHTLTNRLHDMLEMIVNESWRHLDSKKPKDADSVTLFEDDDPLVGGDYMDDMTVITDPISHLNNMKEIRLDGVNRPNVKIYRYPQQHIPYNIAGGHRIERMFWSQMPALYSSPSLTASSRTTV